MLLSLNYVHKENSMPTLRLKTNSWLLAFWVNANILAGQMVNLCQKIIKKSFEREVNEPNLTVFFFLGLLLKS